MGELSNKLWPTYTDKDPERHPKPPQPLPTPAEFTQVVMRMRTLVWVLVVISVVNLVMIAQIWEFVKAIENAIHAL